MLRASRWLMQLWEFSCLRMEIQTPAHAEGARAAGSTSCPPLLLSGWETLLGGDFMVLSPAAVTALFSPRLCNAARPLPASGCSLGFLVNSWLTESQ